MQSLFRAAALTVWQQFLCGNNSWGLHWWLHNCVWAYRRGQVLAATVNEQTMVPFVSQQLNNLELALSLAKRGNLPGAEALVGQNFDRLFASGQFKEAAEAAAESPQVIQPG